MCLKPLHKALNQRALGSDDGVCENDPAAPLRAGRSSAAEVRPIGHAPRAEGQSRKPPPGRRPSAEEVEQRRFFALDEAPLQLFEYWERAATLCAKVGVLAPNNTASSARGLATLRSMAWARWKLRLPIVDPSRVACAASYTAG